MPFHLQMAFFTVRTPFGLTEFLPLVSFCFRCQIQKHIAKTNVRELTRRCSCRSFIVGGLTIQSLIYLESIFVRSIREGHRLMLLPVAVPFPDAFIEETVLSSLHVLGTFVN